VYMKSIFTFLFFVNFVLSFAQSTTPVVGIVYDLDSISDYFILDPPKSEKIVIADKYLFNEEHYILNQFKGLLEAKGFGVLKVNLPAELKPKLYVGTTNVPSSDFSGWMAKERKEKNMTHIIILRHLKLPSELIKESPVDSYIAPEEFGILVYYKQPTEIVVYSVIDYKIYTTSDFKEVYYQPYQSHKNGWRKDIEHESPLTSHGLIIDEHLPLVRAELEAMFMSHIQNISSLIYRN